MRGRIGAGGKAALCAVAVFWVVGAVFIYLEFFTGHVSDAKVRLNQSVKYSQEELSAAVGTLKKELFLKMWGCDLLEVSYREWIDREVTEDDRKEMAIGENEEYIILETKSLARHDFRHWLSGSLVEEGIDDQEWVLVWNKENGKWRVAGSLGGG